MTVYFTASIAGKKEYCNNYLAIIGILQRNGYKVISDHIIKTTTETIKKEEKEARLKFHTQLEKWIKSCDFVVAETSYPSISVGYEISLAINLGKPLLILYTGDNLPTLFIHYQEGAIICKKYTLDNLTNIIANFIKSTKNSADVKFTFFITKEMANFLKKISLKERISKSVYLRDLIQHEIKEALT